MLKMQKRLKVALIHADDAGKVESCIKLVMKPVIVHTNGDIKLGNVGMQPQKITIRLTELKKARNLVNKQYKEMFVMRERN
jgi:hypothetical protein